MLINLLKNQKRKKSAECSKTNSIESDKSSKSIVENTSVDTTEYVTCRTNENLDTNLFHSQDDCEIKINY